KFIVNVRRIYEWMIFPSIKNLVEDHREKKRIVTIVNYPEPVLTCTLMNTKPKLKSFNKN
ncbi:MAG: hypothetical protein C0399_12825, partial [Syntrophus sp. (in: bacteria)]|nr:hypothetical protein [Syntrophus sp. (in: bacteria)]